MGVEFFQLVQPNVGRIVGFQLTTVNHYVRKQEGKVSSKEQKYIPNLTGSTLMNLFGSLVRVGGTCDQVGNSVRMCRIFL